MAGIERVRFILVKRLLMNTEFRRTFSFAATYQKYKPKKQIQWFSMISKATFAVLGMVLPEYLFQEENYNEVQDYDYDKPKVKRMLMSMEENIELKLEAALKNIHADHQYRKKYKDGRLAVSVSDDDFEEFKDEMLERVTALKASLHSLIKRGSELMEENRLKIIELDQNLDFNRKYIDSQKARIDQMELELIRCLPPSENNSTVVRTNNISQSEKTGRNHTSSESAVR